MGVFDDGCREYLLTSAVVDNPFPIDKHGTAYIACIYCRYYRESARRCGLTNEVVPFPTKYVGHNCPLKPIENKEET